MGLDTRFRWRRWLLAAVGVPALGIGVLGIEVVSAQRGKRLVEFDPHLVDRQAERTLPDGRPERRVVWLGDSLAAGVGSSSPATALPRLMALPGDEVHVLALSGATVSEVLDRQVPLVVAIRPDLMFVSVGANDVTHLTSVDDFAARYRKVIDALPSGVPVVLLGVPDMGSPPRLSQPLRAIAGWRGRRLDQEIRKLAASVHDRRVSYVDIAGPTGPVFRHDHRRFAADGYHPSDLGYPLWADAIRHDLSGSGIVVA